MVKQAGKSACCVEVLQIASKRAKPLSVIQRKIVRVASGQRVLPVGAPVAGTLRQLVGVLSAAVDLDRQAHGTTFRLITHSIQLEHC